MANLSKNFLYNLALTISGYVFPLLTYPYITRVLGPTEFGAANFALSVVDYAILFSSLGISSIGIKEIAKCGNDKEKIGQVFSSLVSLHIIMTGIMSLLYIIVVTTVPEFRSELRLYGIGLCKLLFNVFLVEWLYTGLQNFKYITIRSLIVKSLYVILVFLCVRKQGDYWIYVALTVFQVVANAIINWRYSKQFLSFKFDVSSVRQFFNPVLSLGVNMILFSFYTSFITLYLGFACSKESVGYFTTSTKMYSMILAAISAFNGVLMPHMNSLYGQGEFAKMKDTVEKAITLVLCLSFPLSAYFYASAEDVIILFAGAAFERSILPFKIIIIQVVLIGISQILELQILLTFNKLKEILHITIATSLLSVVITICFAHQYAEVAAAYAVMIPHIVECALLFIEAKKCINFKVPLRQMLIYMGMGMFIIGVYLMIRTVVDNLFLRIAISLTLSTISYVVVLRLTSDPISCIVNNKIKEIIKVRDIE